MNDVTGPEPSSHDRVYPRYPEGIYDAECVKAATYRDRQFNAWKCCLYFRLVPSGEPVCGYWHLGMGAEAYAGPRSEYRRAWIIANGDGPRKRQRLSARNFTGKLFEVRLGDVTRDSRGREHPAGAIYSTVKEIIRRLP